MILNTKGKLARFYQWTYGTHEENLPQSLCVYFWKLVVAIVLFPITWLSYPWGFERYYSHNFIWDRTIDESFKMRVNYESNAHMIWKRFFTGLFLWFVLIVLAAGLAKFFFLLENTNILEIIYHIFMMTFSIIGGIALAFLFLGVIKSFFFLKEKVKESETFMETRLIVEERVEGFFENYCPKINWENKKDE